MRSPRPTPAETAHAHLRAVGTGYLRFARDEPGLFRAAYTVPSDLEQAFSPEKAGPSGRTPFQLLGIALDETGRRRRDARRAPARRRAACAWSSVHGLAMLVLEGPLRDLDEATLQQRRARADRHGRPRALSSGWSQHETAHRSRHPGLARQRRHPTTPSACRCRACTRWCGTTASTSAGATPDPRSADTSSRGATTAPVGIVLRARRGATAGGVGDLLALQHPAAGQPGHDVLAPPAPERPADAATRSAPTSAPTWRARC